MKCDEAFYCGTGREVSRIISVNGKKLRNRGNAAKMISFEYGKIVHGKNKKYKNWLTPVK
jgi:branched-chain amino acid aminotransferase